MAWLPGYLHRKPVPLTGGSDGAFTDFQLKLAIAFVTDHMQSDFDDLRFTKEDGETLIDAWLEDKTDSTSADVWVEFPSTPANGDTQTYYMYYDKADAVSDWDISETFLFGDDFEDGVVSDWYAIHGTPTIEAVNTPAYGSYALHIAGTGAYEYAAKDISTIDNFAIHAKIRAAETNLDHFLLLGQDYDNPIRVLRLGGNGVLNYYNGSSYAAFPTPTSYLANTWYDVEIRVQTSSDKFEMIWDGTSIGSGLWDTSFSYENCDMILPGDASGADTYIDNIFVRKYTANPPTYEFGSEESAPTGGNPFWYYQMLKRRNN